MALCGCYTMNTPHIVVDSFGRSKSFSHIHNLRFYTLSMKSIWLGFLLLIMCSSVALGQTFIQNTMYDFNRFVYNPATAGLGDQGADERWSLTALGRLQWAGIDGSPQLMSVSANRTMSFGGVGAYIMRDEVGPISSTSLNVAYSYQTELSSGDNLALGLSVGFSQRALNLTVLAVNPNDPILPPNGTLLNESVLAPNLAVGGFYQGMKDEHMKYFIGLSGQDLLEPNISDLVLNNTGGTSTVPRSFYLTAGYRFAIGVWTSDNADYIQPTILARTQGAVFQSDISVLGKYKQFHAGLNYRGVAFAGDNSESMGAMIGFDVPNSQLFFGYSYDYNLSGLNINGDASSHEIILIYKFGKDNEGEKGPKDTGNVIKD